MDKLSCEPNLCETAEYSIPNVESRETCPSNPSTSTLIDNNESCLLLKWNKEGGQLMGNSSFLFEDEPRWAELFFLQCNIIACLAHKFLASLVLLSLAVLAAATLSSQASMAPVQVCELLPPSPKLTLAVGFLGKLLVFVLDSFVAQVFPSEIIPKSNVFTSTIDEINLSKKLTVQTIL